MTTNSERFDAFAGFDKASCHVSLAISRGRIEVTQRKKAWSGSSGALPLPLIHTEKSVTILKVRFVPPPYNWFLLLKSGRDFSIVFLTPSTGLRSLNQLENAGFDIQFGWASWWALSMDGRRRSYLDSKGLLSVQPLVD